MASLKAISDWNPGIKGHSHPCRPPFHHAPPALASSQTCRGDENMPVRDGLIASAELAGILGQPDLRLFDCTTYLEYQPEGSGVPYITVPGWHTFEAAHIPGADFLDLQGEFSVPNIELHFMMPATAQLEAAFG